MQKTVSFKKKIIATTIASVAAGMSSVAFAQDSNEPIDEVVITGIKASLIRSEEIKRNASGVVDAISAEDMGKFPDTNLAESLQRITGVSIDRSNGEGSKITVRGFGPEFNMITLNGRQMPASGINATSPNYTRAFDFANLAADGVEALEVYKTGRADVTSGGIGSTINIKTPKPLDKAGFRASVGVKAGYDDSQIDGTDVTPEVSGLVSSTFADDTVGVLFLASYSDRKNGSQQESQTNWFHQDISVFNNPALVLEDNRADKTSQVFFPRAAGYAVAEVETKRTNAQLVFQWAPSDAIKTTLDYTYSGLETESTRNTFGAWFVGGQDAVSGGVENKLTVDKNGTAVFFEERGGDYSWDRWHDGAKNENNSVGLNVAWQTTDTLELVLDAHKSKAESKPLGGVDGNSAGLIMGDPNVVTKTFSVGNGDIPAFDFVFGTPNGEADPAKIATQFGFTRQGIVTSDVDQLQLKSIWKNADENSALSAIDFGVGTLDQKQESQFNEQFAHRADWGYGGADLFDDSMFTRKSTGGLLDAFSRGGSQAPYYYDYNFDDVLAIARPTWVTNEPDRIYGQPNPAHNQFRTIEEKSSDAFVQFHIKSELNGKPFNALAGVRWESTSTESTTLQTRPISLQWTGPTEKNVENSTTAENVKGKGRYEVFLPSLDTSLDFTDDIKGRFSYSRTMARPTIGNLVADFSVGSVNNASASSGNPALKPFLSDNIDLSAEWYYDAGSYVSLGLFKKNVENFITDSSTVVTFPGLYDPQKGARANAAVAELKAGGNAAPTPADILTQIRADEGLAAGAPVVGNSTDPLFQWNTVTHLNNKSAKIWGLEFAIQHLFGESGFGTSFNYTKVHGDLSYDVKNFDFQFVLPGLSDTANFSAFWEKNDISVRLSYNWRDSFLQSTVDYAGTNNPVFTKAYGQFDLSATYNLTDNLSFSFDGLNLTNETQTHYGRYENQVIDATQYGARYAVGARYKF